MKGGRHWHAAIGLAAALLTPATAWAQAYQCRLPAGPVSVPVAPRDGPVRQVPIAGYTLALSWSPEYCRARQNSAADRRQCSGQAGRFGFIVHGLWPEGRGSAWPQWCPTAHSLPPAEARRNLCMTPSARLLAHEWAKHGSCMVRRPESYFRITRILWNSLRWPDLDRLSRQDGLTAGDLRRTFAAANPYWEPEHVGIQLSANGWLRELRLCYGKDFMPAPCDTRRRGPGDEAELRIWRGL